MVIKEAVSITLSKSSITTFIYFLLNIDACSTTMQSCDIAFDLMLEFGELHTASASSCPYKSKKFYFFYYSPLNLLG